MEINLQKNFVTGTEGCDTMGTNQMQMPQSKREKS